MSTPASSFDGRPELRETIAELAWFAGANADVIVRQCELGDDTAVAYQVKRLTAYVRAIIGIVNKLTEDNKKRIGGATNVTS